MTACKKHDIFSLFCLADVKSWLVMFGFQLSNIIPGFPRHSLYFVDPPYEILASQDSDNIQVSLVWRSFF